MTLFQDVTALWARQDLTPTEKRRRLYELKGQAIVNFLTPKVGQVFTRGVYTAQMTANPQYDRGLLTFPGLVLTKNGVQVPLSLPLSITNPGISVDDGAGGFKEDILVAARDMLMGIAK